MKLIAGIPPILWAVLAVLFSFRDGGEKLYQGIRMAQAEDSSHTSNLPTKPGTLAVIFSGDVRGWANFVDSQVEMLKHIAPNYTVHVYMMPKIAREEDNPTTLVQFGRALEKIRPFLQYFTVQEADSRWDDVMPHPQGCTAPLLPPEPKEGWAYVFYQQFAPVYRLYSEVLRQEATNGWRYEWFIRSRMDLHWYSKPDFSLATAATDIVHVTGTFNYDHVPSVSDHFAVMHGTIAETYLTVADKMFQGTWCRPQEDFNDYCPEKNTQNVPPECYLARWLADHTGPKGAWQTHFFDFNLRYG